MTRTRPLHEQMAVVSTAAQAAADREVFAKAAMLRQLPSVQLRKPSAWSGTVASPISSRRPATASATSHSRVHQALRRNMSEFGLNANHPRVEEPSDQRNDTSGSAAVEDDSRPKQQRGMVRHRSQTVVPRQRGMTRKRLPSPLKSNQRTESGNLSIQTLIKPPNSPQQLANHADTPLVARSSSASAEEVASIHRQRRCAKTFADMIAARISPRLISGSSNVLAPSAEEVEAGNRAVETLLSDGIVHSLLNLSVSSDATTIAHCCRALYYLSSVERARKVMVAQGVVTAIRQLSRTPATEPREDLAAMLCRLAEQPGATELLFFEGIDRTLVRLYSSSSAETRRICALAVFNLSVEASELKHFGEAFSQLLVNFTKGKPSGSGTTSSVSTAASLPAVTFLLKAVYNVALFPQFHNALLGESVPRYLLQQLPVVPPPVQCWALRSLVLLCGSRLSRMQLFSQQLCKELRFALTGTDEAAQELALIVLLQLSMDEGSRIKLCNWVPAGAIVRSGQQHLSQTETLALEESPETNGSEHWRRRLHFHAHLFRNLCDSVLTHHELIEEGVVPVLLAMARIDEITLKATAISAMCSIISSSTDDVSDDIPEVIEQLLCLSMGSDLERCTFAVTALYNISCCDDSLVLLGNSASLLSTVLQLATSLSQPHLADLVSAIVYRLATAPECAPKLLQHGYLHVLIKLIHRFPTCRTFALNALFLLAQHGGAEFPHGGDEISQLVVALLSDGEDSAVGLVRKGEAVTDPVMVRSAVTLLAHLASHPTNRTVLVRHGTVFKFLKKMHRANDEEDIVLTNCAFVFYCLTATQEGSEVLVKERGIEDIIHLARAGSGSTGGDPHEALTDFHAVQELCMQSLCRLSSYFGLESRLIEQGAIEGAMVLALVKSDRMSIKALCIKLLANCLVSKPCTRSLVDNGVTWALSSLCLVPYPASYADVYPACAISLCNLSAVSAMVPKFLDAGAPRALTHLLHQAVDASTVLVTIKAIANLVANEKICQAFLNEDIERHLSRHFDARESSDETRQLAAMVLLRTTSISNDLISVDHLRNRVFRWMEQIVVIKEEELVRNCMLTVHDLTCNPAIDATELDVPHVLRIVVHVLHRHRLHLEIVTLCLSVVYNLSCEPSLLHYLVTADIMGFLRQQIPPTQPGCSRQYLDPAIDLEPPSSSGPPHKSTAMRFSCLILHNLSCSAAAPDPTHRDAVPVALVGFHAAALLRDVFCLSRNDLRETSAVALCNLAIGKVNSTKLLDDGVHKVLVAFAYSPQLQQQPDHITLLSAAYRKLGNAPGNQRRLLAAGIAKAMITLLSGPETSTVAKLNLLWTLSRLSQCGEHAQQLAEDGVLPCIVHLVDHSTITSELQTHCFEIVSNVCTANFQDQSTSEVNVVGTLMKLSEHHHRPHHHTIDTAPNETYYARGEGQPLPLPELLTYMMKSPSSSTSFKKNLELKATYAVTARKWASNAQPTPKDPPPLLCGELPLADPGQTLPPEVKQQIASLVLLPREPLVRGDAAVSSTEGGSNTPPAESGGRVNENNQQPAAALSTPKKLVRPSTASVAGPRRLTRAASGRHILATCLDEMDT